MKRNAAAVTEQISFKASIIDSTETVVTWDIENFRELCPHDAILETKHEIDSPPHTTKLNLGGHAPSEIEWLLTLVLKRNPTLPVNRYQLFAHVAFLGDQTPRLPLWNIRAKLSIIGRNNVPKPSGSGVIFPDKQQAFNCLEIKPEILTMTPMWYNMDSHSYLVNDTLHLKVELTFVHQPRSWVVSVVGQLELESSHSDEVLATMTQLWKTGQDADVKIFCDDKEFNVHSNVIKARSPVLQRMLESGMVESNEKIIKITDVAAKDIEALLEYLYTGKLPEPLEGANSATPFIDLVQVADKYEVLKLRDYCFQRMTQLISLQNAGEITVFAYLHSAPHQVRSRAFKFCEANWDSLSNDASFKTLTQQHPAAFLPVGRSTQ